MAAGIFGVEDDALGREQIAEARGDRLVVVPAVEPAADAGLVGDDHQRVARLAEPAERLRHAGENPHVVGVGEVARVLDQRAVAIEKERRAVPTRRFGETEAVEAVVHAAPHALVGEGFVGGGAEQVAEEDVHLLDARGLVVRHDQAMIGEPLRRDLAAVAAGQAGGDEPQLAGGDQRRADSSASGRRW